MLKHAQSGLGRAESLITVQDNTMLKPATARCNEYAGLITVQDNTMLKQKISTNPNMSV